jgi:hypothetical protein
MIPVPEAFNVLRLFFKTVQDLGTNLSSQVNQDGHRKPKTGKNALKFLSIGVILQHVCGIARGNIHEKFDVESLAVVAPVINSEVKKLVSDKETVLQVKRKSSNGTKFHIMVTGCSMAMIGFSKGNLVHHDENSMGILVIGRDNHTTEVTQLSLVQ